MARTSASKKSRRTHQFDRTAQATIPRSSFDRSHSLKTAFDAADLIPIYVDEVYPGDTHSVRASLFGRLATLQKPILDSLFLDTFFFFVPNRLVWENWQKFMGEQENPGDSTDFTIPAVGTNSAQDITGWGAGDYFGLPHVTNFDMTACSALPFRGYNLIFQEWFKDQNLQDAPALKTDDGPDAGTADYPLRKRGKRHDYFSSCLPWPQKGDPITVPLGQSAPVVTGNDHYTGGPALRVGSASSGTPSVGDRTLGVDNINPGDVASFSEGGLTGADPIIPLNLVADLTSATGFTINQLRESFQIQRLMERDARGGTRYTEVIRAHFGVTSPDARLQRPEFLGGGSTVMNVIPVPNTTDAGTAPQGDLAAQATVAARGHGFTKSFVEHGYVIGLVNVRADLIYQQGLQRFWSRKTKYDFYWPALSHLGEMAVLGKEIYYDGTAGDEDVFGYQEAWADLRYKPSFTTSLMRSDASTSLDYWHLGLDFGSRPVLGATFIEDNPPVDRVIAVPSERQVLLDAYFKVRSVRPMPMYGTPGLIDHF